MTTRTERITHAIRLMALYLVTAVAAMFMFFLIAYIDGALFYGWFISEWPDTAKLVLFVATVAIELLVVHVMRDV